MRHAILIAALALASACIIEPVDNGRATLYWSFWASASLGDFGDVAWSATKICDAAAADVIELTLVDPRGDVVQPVRSRCVTASGVPAVELVGMQAGTWQYSADAFRGDVLVYSDHPANAADNTFTVVDGTTTEVDTRLAALHEDVQIGYTVSSVADCSRIEFELRDSTHAAPVYSTRPDTVDPTIDVACAASGSRVIPSVPPDTYELLPWVQYGMAGTPVKYSACSPSWTQSAFAGATVSVAVSADVAGSVCP